MKARIQALAEKIEAQFGEQVRRLQTRCGELGYEIAPGELIEVCTALRDTDGLDFQMLMDVCGVDYLTYGKDEWTTFDATETGFSRGVRRGQPGMEAHFAAATDVDGEPVKAPSRRFAVVYHLLSIRNNTRLRLVSYCEDDEYPMIDSVVDVWSSANWFEREAFDLFGILFRGHPDLRRLLTDYGFIGHPFRKDFPLIGEVEVRYDPDRRRVVYEPVSIEPRTLVPRVIRDDHRYEPQIRDDASFREAGGNA